MLSLKGMKKLCIQYSIEIDFLIAFEKSIKLEIDFCKLLLISKNLIKTSLSKVRLEYFCANLLAETNSMLAMTNFL